MPENLSVTISAADGNSLAHMSEIEKMRFLLTKQKLSSIISDTQFEELKSGKTTIYDKVSSLEQTSEEIKTTVKETVTQIGDLEYGGENYIKNSKTLFHQDYVFMDQNFVMYDDKDILTDEDGEYFLFPERESMDKQYFTTEEGNRLTDENVRYLITYT